MSNMNPVNGFAHHESLFHARETCHLIDRASNLPSLTLITEGIVMKTKSESSDPAILCCVFCSAKPNIARHY